MGGQAPNGKIEGGHELVRPFLIFRARFDAWGVRGVVQRFLANISFHSKLKGSRLSEAKAGISKKKYFALKDFRVKELGI